DTRRFWYLAAEIEPVAEVIAHVIAAEWQHRKRIAADLADVAECGCRHFRPHCRRHIDAERPIERLLDQRNDAVAAAAEDKRRHGHAFWIVKILIDDRALRRWGG